MDYLKGFKDSNSNSNYSAKTSPFRKGKLPTRPIRVRMPYYNKIRKYAFIKHLPKSSVIDKVMQYGMHDYERLNKFGKYHK